MSFISTGITFPNKSKLSCPPEIDREDKTSIEQKKAKIARLILALNEDNDIEEQQQTLEVIDSSAGVSI